jgi:preprotein translocase subunit SecF
MEVEFKQRPEVGLVQELMSKDTALKEVSISPFGERGMIFRLAEIDENTHQKLLSDLRGAWGEIQEKRFSSIGGVIGKELRHNSIVGIIIVLVSIMVYIAFVFRKLSRTLSPWSLGVAAIIALAHDVIIPMGVFAFLGHYYDIQITAIFVAAVLTILGFSVSDTVVVFDRVRENVLRFGSRESFSGLVHQSIMQTLARSLNTTFTMLLALVAIYFFGGESVRYFSLAMIIGIFLGSYSSIFVASPILMWWSGGQHSSSRAQV